ncbi:hypothetical protein ACLEQD_43145, partial [Corallococcus sp. 4LFB]
RFPGLARESFYELLATAEDPARVEALLPLARVLDHAAGGTVLEDTVRRVAALDFTRRARSRGSTRSWCRTRIPVRRASLNGCARRPRRRTCCWARSCARRAWRARMKSCAP